jgi:hypothetical protein
LRKKKIDKIVCRNINYFTTFAREKFKKINMKKITNNAPFGKLAMLFNILIFFFFIIAIVCLLSFDKVNVKLVSETSAYKEADTEMREVEKPRRQAQADLDYYVQKLENLTKQEIPADKKKAKEHQEEIERTKNTLASKEEELEKVDARIAEQNILYEAIRVPFDDLTKQANSAKNIFSITLWITILLFVVKVLFFATWNYKSLINLRLTSPWMKKSTSPYWAYLSWLIPGYNLVKPYNVFSEIYLETNYILIDKNVVKQDTDSNADFYLGLWWGMFIIAAVIMSFILNATFFSEGPMYFKLSHVGVAITAIILWAFYLLQETVLIWKAIKMNQILCENHSKFDLP